jgi:two-component system phosphate regulon sensor histidine kinase PhoR
MGRRLAALRRNVHRLADTTLSSWRWTERDDLAGLTNELSAITTRLRDRLDELTEERDRAGQILDALDDGVLLLDGAGRLLVANPAARSWFGLPDNLRPGLPVKRVLGIPQVAALAEEAAEARAPVVGTLTLVFPEPRTLAMRAFPLADRGPTGRIVVTMTDITQRRRLEVLRRDFVANASHELKTPVAAVRALAETLLTALPDDPEAGRRFADRIGREAERLDVLVRDLLDLSRVERGTLDVEPVDLVGLAKEVVGGYADRAEERHITLGTELQPGIAMRGDRAQLGLLLSNLIDNALRYTPAKGSVCVRLDAAEGRAVLQVADTGEGIPAGELPRIFERFYRVDKARVRQTGGTGLGLAIVRHVAEAHGGAVRADSELARGSTFTVTLPLAGSPPAVV